MVSFGGAHVLFLGNVDVTLEAGEAIHNLVIFQGQILAVLSLCLKLRHEFLVGRSTSFHNVVTFDMQEDHQEKMRQTFCPDTRTASTCHRGRPRVGVPTTSERIIVLRRLCTNSRFAVVVLGLKTGQDAILFLVVPGLMVTTKVGGDSLMIRGDG